MAKIVRDTERQTGVGEVETKIKILEKMWYRQTCTTQKICTESLGFLTTFVLFYCVAKDKDPSEHVVYRPICVELCSRKWTVLHAVYQ